MEFLKKLSLLVSICRPVNIFLAALTQWGVHHYLLEPFLSDGVLVGHLLYLFILCTAFLMAGGFVINDILDVESDVINRPLKPISSFQISIKSASVFYLLLVVCGANLAMYIAWKIGQIHLAILYFGWVFLLYAYSKWWKGTVLAGNVLVSIFVASAPAMMLFAERDALSEIGDTQKLSYILELFLFMVLLSFLLNLVREIAKDVEDQAGDLKAGYHTFVVRYGEKAAKTTMVILISLTIVLCISWMFFTSISLRLQEISMLSLFVVAPSGVAIQILTSSTHKRTMGDLSGLLRWVLFAGVITCLTISQTFAL